jgi:hypothetical protein
VTEVVAVVDRQPGDRLQRAQVDLLPLGRVRVVRSGADSGGEVADPVNRVLGQQPRAEGAEIEPAVRRSFQAAVVELEGTTYTFVAMRSTVRPRSVEFPLESSGQPWRSHQRRADLE